MTKEQDTLESKYRMVVKVSCLIALVVIVLIDAIIEKFNAPVEVELALVATVAGLEIKEKAKQMKKHKRKK